MDFAAAGTGFDVWTSALLLCRWLCSPSGLARSRVRERTVLELGAGCGAVGLTAAHLGARSVVLTDNQPEVLETLRTAVLLNGLDPQRTRVASLDWAVENGESAQPEYDPNVAPLTAAAAAAGGPAAGGLLEGERFGLVLGSDCVYELAHPRLVVGTAVRRLEPGGLLVLVMTVRSLQTRARLLEQLRAEPRLHSVSIEQLESESGELAMPELVEGGTTMHAAHYPGGICLICARAVEDSPSAETAAP